MPYIVNELIYFICNNALDIYKVVNPQAKQLTSQQFQTLLLSIKFKPSNPKELPALMSYLSMPGQAGVQISMVRFLELLRKVDPSYG